MKYIIPGTPVAQARPRGYIKKGKIRKYDTVAFFDPVKSRNYKKLVAHTLKTKYKPTPTEQPIKMTIDIFVPIPKSYTKKVKEEILAGRIRPAKKPDVSNFVKGIEDACNKILYKDDNQIIELVARKYYSESPRIEIQIEEIL